MEPVQTPQPVPTTPVMGALEGGLGLTVAAVARRLGVAPATLRTWDRRYGLGPSAHTAGAHRRYSSSDLARLEVMRSLVFEGCSPADAAQAALSSDFCPEVPVESDSSASVPAPDADQPYADQMIQNATLAPSTRRRTGGGRVVPIHGGSPRARGLARAALALDAPSVRRLVTESLHERGTVWTWDHLVAPVLIGVGQRFESTGQGIDLEHLFSEGIVGALRDVAEAVPETRSSRPIVLSSAPDDLHTLPLHAVAAGLAERGIPTRILGARVPVEALMSAVRRVGPPAVFLWSHDHSTGDPAVLTSVPAMRPAPLVVVGGPGWPSELPEGIVRVADLGDAITRLAAATRGLG